MTTEIKLMRGLQASGKSTIAHAWVAENPDWRIRINRDDLRTQTANKLWGLTHHQEQTVSLLEEAMASSALSADISVVVDATHLRASHVKRWYDFANKRGVPVSVHDVDTPLEVCIERDKVRIKSVGEDVIRDYHKRFFVKGKLPELPVNEAPEVAGRAYTPNPDLPKAVWVDVDGTLAERVHPLAVQPVRGPFDENRVFEDAVIEHALDTVVALKNHGYKIVIMSGRSDACLEETTRWLNHHGVPFDDIFMRKSGDQRKDSVVKEELFWNNVVPKYDVRFALDDRQQVVDHTREVLNIPVFQVAPGNF